jgi:deoxyribose-phosphate aldolase
MTGSRSVEATEERNPGIPLDLDRIRTARVNRSAVERRVAALAAARAIKGSAQAAWLLRAITLIDLTTLQGDDTAGRVMRLVGKARAPVRSDLLAALDLADDSIQVAAICVYHAWVETAVAGLAGTKIPVAAVSTGFPAGLVPHAVKLAEIRASVEAGAREVDAVITRSHVLTGNWSALYEEVRDFRAAASSAHLKVILATGELGSLGNVYRASWVGMMAGADFIKTSTGKEAVNATLPVGLVMARAIRAYREETGYAVGLKAAGGIRSAKEALEWLAMVRIELGTEWLVPARFRLGASTLLADLERQLEQQVTGQYTAARRYALG